VPVRPRGCRGARALVRESAWWRACRGTRAPETLFHGRGSRPCSSGPRTHMAGTEFPPPGLPGPPPVVELTLSPPPHPGRTSTDSSSTGSNKRLRRKVRSVASRTDTPIGFITSYMYTAGSAQEVRPAARSFGPLPARQRAHTCGLVAITRRALAGRPPWYVWSFGRGTRPAANDQCDALPIQYLFRPIPCGIGT
jgi:hypothetical protein